MPRRGSTKRLNISTDKKLETQAESSNIGEVSQQKPQHQPFGRQASISGQLSGSNALKKSQNHSNSQSLSSATGESNDSRGAPPNIPQHRQSSALVANPIAGKPRTVQIEALLKHRKLLLQRIRQSKQAAETRLANPSRRSIVAVLAEHSDGAKTGGYSKSSVTEKNKQTEEDAYKDLGRIASQAVKKQRNHDDGVEKRLSSLRRGSTVGKRMNVAISDLVPGSLETSDEVTVSAPMSTSILPPNASKNAAKKMKSNISTIQNINNLPSGKNLSENSVGGIKKRSSNKSQKNVTQSKHHYTFTTSHPIETVQPKQSVVFPAAIALRGRKKFVKAKLSDLLLGHQKQLSRSKQLLLQPRLISNAHTKSPTSKFPNRRKTQWDYVMEEMRWLATDFCEERKWKEAVTRVLSSDITSYFSLYREQRSTEVNSFEGTDVNSFKYKTSNINIDEEKKDADVVTESIIKEYGKLEQRKPNLLLLDNWYVEPSEDDVNLSRTTAKHISEQITLLWDHILNGGAHIKISKETNMKIGGEKHPPGKTANIQVLSKESSVNRVTAQDALKDEKENNISSQNAILLMSSNQTNQRIEELLNRIENRPRQRSSRVKSSAKGARHLLSPVEQKACEFIEFVWKGNEPIGAILGNAMSFSPFDVVCSLIPQNSGPHVILCPSSRVLYWFSLLERICARVLLANSNGFLMKNSGDLRSTDVVVADWSSVKMDHTFDISIFECVFLDAFSALSTKKYITAREVRRAIGAHLLSVTWWNSLLLPMVPKKQKRLIISNSFTISKRNEPSTFKVLSEKERLELLAGMTAFVFGPHHFFSHNRSLVHRVLSWAKRSIRRDGMTGKTKIDEIELYLITYLRKVLFSPEIHYGDMQQLFEEKSIVDTEICLCRMSFEQQMAYDKCCRSIRGAISLGGCISDAAKALMQLREVCFHARLRDACKVKFVSSSQTDIYQAVKIMRESTKLRKLVLLLYREFGYEIEGLSVLRTIFPEFQARSKRCGKLMKKHLPKIAIIASSPFVRRLTSIILSAIGISHESLPKIQGVKNDDVNRKSSNCILPWIQGQSSLQRYNSHFIDQNGIPFRSDKLPVVGRNCNIILGSAIDMGAQQHHGLSLESSDTIMLLDEDWSGRESKLIKRLLIRCFLHRKRQDKERSELRVYRFICDDCCEKKILCISNYNEDNFDIDSTQWAVDRFGLSQFKKSFPSWDQSFTHFEPFYIFRFPCRNLLSFANQDLATFLSTRESFPTSLESGRKLEFLPFEKLSENSNEQREYFLKFAKELCISEKILHDGSRSIGKITIDGNNIPKFVSLKDAQIAPTRFLIENYGTHFNFYAKEHSTMPDKTASAKSIDTPTETILSGMESKEGKLNSKKQKSKIHEIATSILFYGATQVGSSHKKRKRDLTENIRNSEQMKFDNKRRFNAFSAIFTSPENRDHALVQDGSQGCEPLVYFPPLFPSLRSVYSKAIKQLSSHNLENKSIRANFTKPSSQLEFKKRSFEGSRGLDVSKRPRVDVYEKNIKSIPKLGTMTSNAQSSAIQAGTQVLKSELKSHIYGNSLPINILQRAPKKVGAKLPIKSEEINLFDNAKKSLFELDELDEDFGLVGVGALPHNHQSFLEAGYDGVALSHHSTATSHEGLYISNDFEENEHFNKNYRDANLGMMIIFASRKGIHAVRSLSPSGAGLSCQPHVLNWNAATSAIPISEYVGAGNINGSTVLNNGNIQSKKSKKKSPTPSVGTGSAISGRTLTDYKGVNQVTAGLVATLTQGKGKDALRQKILTIYGRQNYGTASLFESSVFRMGLIRVCDRIKKKVSRIQLTSDEYNTYSYSLPEHWFSKPCIPPELSWTTIATKPISKKKRKLSHQMESDCSDFGPFHVGQLHFVTDKVNIIHRKPRIGLSLPMGVKIPGQHPGYPSQPWTANEDRDLHVLAMRFGMNWHLVACNLKCSHKPKSRSARQCRERWHNLATEDTSLLCEMEKVSTDISIENYFFLKEENSISRTSDYSRMVKKGSFFELSVDLKADTPQHEQLCLSSNQIYDCILVNRNVPIRNSDSKRQNTHQFAALRMAAMKKQDVPMQIPGVVAGQQPSLAASHPSHHQSLQVAMATLASGGRTDMWPLQILDLADKQQKAISLSPPTATTNRVSHRSIGNYQSPQSRHPPVQQQFVQPNNQARLPAQSQSSSGK